MKELIELIDAALDAVYKVEFAFDQAKNDASTDEEENRLADYYWSVADIFNRLVEVKTSLNKGEVSPIE